MLGMCWSSISPKWEPQCKAGTLSGWLTQSPENLEAPPFGYLIIKIHSCSIFKGENNQCRGITVKTYIYVTSFKLFS